jgi:4-hydroxy-3-methylbut-2-enyl diphosphate reductase
VVGAKNSSNSNRLRELAEKMGCTAYLIDTANDIQQSWLDNITAVGVTAGASAPEVLVQQVVAQLKMWGGKTVNENPGRPENVVFAIPAELR